MAIIADYDLEDESSLTQVRTILQQLKDSALVESFVDPDIGGLYTRIDSDAVGSVETLTEPFPEQDVVDEQIDELDNDAKIAILGQVFPQASTYTIAHTLKKCSGDWPRAIDELLNQQYLASSDEAGFKVCDLKGVEAFSEDLAPRPRGKRKGRSKHIPALDRRRSNSLPIDELTTKLAVNPWTGERYQQQVDTAIVPQYAALSLTDDEDSPISADRTSLGKSHAEYNALGNAQGQAYKHALERAHAAYRKSRSDRLMGGAASYYSQLGREHASATRRYMSSAADSLVDSSSSASQIDLHGVTVQDAVRISRTRAAQWWAALAEDKINGRVGAQRRADGFKIITGKGTHSEGGRGKLGPAVSQALIADGWRIEQDSGAVTVKGKSRK